MNRFSLTHLSNEVLDRELPIKAARRKSATAEELAYIAEFDERKRFLPAAYESMLAYCVGELGLSRDEAKQRIHIARAGRSCPHVARRRCRQQFRRRGRVRALHARAANSSARSRA